MVLTVELSKLMQVSISEGGCDEYKQVKDDASCHSRLYRTLLSDDAQQSNLAYQVWVARRDVW